MKSSSNRGGGDGNLSLTHQYGPMNILAVEDDKLAMGFLEKQISALGHKMLNANNGKKALAVLEGNKGKIDVVLMDRQMPVMDGLETVKEMKKDRDLRNIPVIMITSADSPEEIKEGLDAGVFYYLIKPVERDMLRSVLSAAVREAQQKRNLAEELEQHKAGFQLIESCKFKFATISEAESLAAFMANCFPDPKRVLPGLGELLVNAIEHGNLNLGYDRKTELIDAGDWRKEVDRLAKAPKFADKYAISTLSRKADGMYVTVEDQGLGFDWKKYMTIDLARATDNHGRGIAQANALSFDRLSYNQRGNKASAFVAYDISPGSGI